MLDCAIPRPVRGGGNGTPSPAPSDRRKTSAPADRITVAAHMERWLEHVRSQVSPKTFERYCGVVRGNILPALGAVLLTKLQPAQISEMYAKALASGRRDGKGGLSPASVLYMHRLLKEALQVAVSEWRLLTWNPADPIKAPRVKRKNMRALDTAETAALLEAARPYRLFVPVMLAVTCGLRRGEICALRWRNVELSCSAARRDRQHRTDQGGHPREGNQERARPDRRVDRAWLSRSCVGTRRARPKSYSGLACARRTTCTWSRRPTVSR